MGTYQLLGIILALLRAGRMDFIVEAFTTGSFTFVTTVKDLLAGTGTSFGKLGFLTFDVHDVITWPHHLDDFLTLFSVPSFPAIATFSIAEMSTDQPFITDQRTCPCMGIYETWNLVNVSAHWYGLLNLNTTVFTFLGARF